MDLLKERIMQEGRCFPGGILKVDSFVNHQMDPILMMDLARNSCAFSRTSSTTRLLLSRLRASLLPSWWVI